MNTSTSIKWLHGATFAVFLFFIGIDSAWSEQKVVSEETFQALKQADALLAQGKAQRALQGLSELQHIVNKDNLFDNAVVQQYLAYAYSGTGDLKSVLLAANEALNSGLLDDDAVLGLQLLAGQAAFQLQNYKQSAAHLAQWLQNKSDPDGQIYYMAGYAAYRANMNEKAILYLEKAAVLQNKSSNDIVQLLLSLYLDQKSYTKAEPLVKKMIAKTPKKREWWLYLSGLYVQQNRLNQALATMMLAYYLTEVRQSDIVQLISLNVQQGLPTKAAKLLETELASQRIPRNYKNLKLLYNCWQLARENNKAKRVLAEAANLASHGEDFLVLGRLSMRRNDWASAKTNFQESLRKGGLKQPHQARLWLGIAALKTKDEVLARQMLEPLLKMKNIKQQARYWLKRIDHSKNTNANSLHG